ncbi:MAG: serine/threonine protein kinase, partial [Anaerolineae bacterium]|nr:serine/threonine protein kinase [Anaerolineae bacterium]
MPIADDVLQNRYRIIAQLGKGGMGAVYRAWDMRLGIPVALKQMAAQPELDADVLADLRDQFQQEAVTLARLSHPNLVGVTDYFQQGRNVYLVMKFVEGESLSERIKRQGALPESDVLAWTAQLLDALAYCHSHGVIHRDIKPQNIIISPREAAVLVDFGLVKLWDPGDPRTRSAVRGVGTPEYAPPEQYELTAG